MPHFYRAPRPSNGNYEDYYKSDEYRRQVRGWVSELELERDQVVTERMFRVEAEPGSIPSESELNFDPPTVALCTPEIISEGVRDLNSEPARPCVCSDSDETAMVLQDLPTLDSSAPCHPCRQTETFCDTHCRPETANAGLRDPCRPPAPNFNPFGS